MHRGSDFMLSPSYRKSLENGRSAVQASRPSPSRLGGRTHQYDLYDRNPHTYDSPETRDYQGNGDTTTTTSNLSHGRPDEYGCDYDSAIKGSSYRPHGSTGSAVAGGLAGHVERGYGGETNATRIGLGPTIDSYDTKSLHGQYRSGRFGDNSAEVGAGGNEKEIASYSSYYGGSNRSYGESDRNFGEANRNYSESNRNYSERDRNYDENDRRYGESDRNYGKSDWKYGESDRSYGESDRMYGESDRKYAESDRKYGQSDQKYGRSDRKYGQSDRNYDESQRSQVKQQNNEQEYAEGSGGLQTNHHFSKSKRRHLRAENEMDGRQSTKSGMPGRDGISGRPGNSYSPDRAAPAAASHQRDKFSHRIGQKNKNLRKIPCVECNELFERDSNYPRQLLYCKKCLSTCTDSLNKISEGRSEKSEKSATEKRQPVNAKTVELAAELGLGDKFSDSIGKCGFCPLHPDLNHKARKPTAFCCHCRKHLCKQCILIHSSDSLYQSHALTPLLQ